MNNVWMLAEVSPNTPAPITSEPADGQTQTMTAQDGNTPATAPPPPKGGQYMQFGLLALMMVFLYFVMFRGPKKKQQQQQKMISSLKKNDRVQTIGGILGTVIDVKDDEVVIKIDEANNTKLRVVHGAISRVLSDDKKTE